MCKCFRIQVFDFKFITGFRFRYEWVLPLFSYFVGFNCNEFNIKLVKIAQDSEICDLIAIDSQVDNPWKVTWKAHARSWRIKCQTIFRESLCDLANPEWPAKLSSWIILSVTLISFTHTIYTLINHKIVRRLFRRKP